MTMPSSGPISIGQARNEMSQGNPINAGNYAVSQLAGVSPGQRYAWSYWRGKSKPFPYQAVIHIEATVDRNLYISYNMRTGQAAVYASDGDTRTQVLNTTAYIGPQPNLAGNLVASIPNGQQTIYYNYDDGNGTIVQQPYRHLDYVNIAQNPSAANDWTLIVHFNDDASYSSGGCAVDIYVGAG